MLVSGFFDDMTSKNYLGHRVSLLTQHGKELLVRHPLETALGCVIEHTSAFDTDTLGTFTRDIDRPCTQLEAARKKALMGMELTHAPIGLASEGSFGADPFTGFMSWNTEIVLWKDQELDLEVVGMAQGPAQCTQKKIKNLDELKRFANEAQFPSHHLVLRPDHENNLFIIKGLQEFSALEQAFNRCLGESQEGVVYVENDLRAFCNPTRQKMIVRATEDLIQKLTSKCPECSTPGYWVKERKSGLPCAACGAATRQPLSEILQCLKCNHTQSKPLAEAQRADPARCDICNP